MESRAALGAAAALALTVTGGVSALFLAVGQASGAESSPTVTDAAVTVEYVDQYGNPVAAPGSEAGDTTPEIVLLNPDGTVVSQSDATNPAATDGHMNEAGEYVGDEEHEEDEAYEDEEDEADEYESGEYEDEADEYDEDGDYEDGDDEEDEEDYEEDEEDYEEYAAGGHVEDEDHGEHEDHTNG